MTLYDRIAAFYDPWSRSVTEDVEFYVGQALASGGPVVELAVGQVQPGDENQVVLYRVEFDPHDDQLFPAGMPIEERLTDPIFFYRTAPNSQGEMTATATRTPRASFEDGWRFESRTP